MLTFESPSSNSPTCLKLVRFPSEHRLQLLVACYFPDPVTLHHIHSRSGSFIHILTGSSLPIQIKLEASCKQHLDYKLQTPLSKIVEMEDQSLFGNGVGGVGTTVDPAVGVLLGLHVGNLVRLGMGRCDGVTASVLGISTY